MSRHSRFLRFLAAVTSLLAAFVDLVLPGECAGCGAPAAPLCKDCGPALGRPAVPVWPRPVPAGLPPPFAVGRYEGVLRDVLLAHKERGCRPLAAPLGTALARAVVASCGRRPVAVVPVPSTRRATRRRGHDPTDRIARVAVTELRRQGIEATRLAGLVHTRVVRDQAGLSAAERTANLRGALAVRAGAASLVRDRRVVVVDDVLTTGATIVEATRALAAAGAHVVAAATVAATGRRA